MMYVCVNCGIMYEEPYETEWHHWSSWSKQIESETVELCPYCSSRQGHEDAEKIDEIELLDGISYTALKRFIKNEY